MLSEDIKALADKYENKSFLDGDPSCFMHNAESIQEQEMVAFLASSLSFGMRKVFMEKIRFILFLSQGRLYEWIKSGAFKCHFKSDDERSFYRFYTYGDMYEFFQLCQRILVEYSTLGNFVEKNVKDRNALTAICAFCEYFNKKGRSKIIPKPTSACKRLCMFLRWMVRDKSPVDIGIWADKLNKSTLIIPLDVHVLRQAVKLNLIGGSNPKNSMKLALELSEKLSTIFPGDPCKGDFALFGLGVEESK
jgi:uncharacterized protein (TIGR02757 family)